MHFVCVDAEAEVFYASRIWSVLRGDLHRIAHHNASTH